MDSMETTQNETSTADAVEQPTTVEIDGQQVDLEELKKGYLRQSDYTKKTTELAREREELEKLKETPQSDDDVAVDAYLQSKGYVTKEDLEAERERIKHEQEMDRFFMSNPDLANHEEAIRAIAKTDDSALEDIVVKYNFSEKDKLNKAKSSRVLVGDTAKKENKQKTIKDMTPEEYSKRKATKGISNRMGSFE